MKICHVCSTVCEDLTELCPVCGAELTEEENNDESLEGIEDAVIANPVLVASVEDVVSAEIFKDILTENKIPYSCDQEAAMRVTFGGGLVSQEIFVDNTDLEAAVKLYEEFLKLEEELESEFFDEEFDGEV